jgi:hypothetical protein
VAESELPTCPACGWSVLRYDNHSSRCQPALGAAADALAKATSVPSTKLGYGSERLTFQVDADFTVGLDVHYPWNRDGSERDAGRVVFAWRRLHCLGELTVTDAADLADTLAAWRARCQARAAEVPVPDDSRVESRIDDKVETDLG